jgi:hypothetical protein
VVGDFNRVRLVVGGEGNAARGLNSALMLKHRANESEAGI